MMNSKYNITQKKLIIFHIHLFIFSYEVIGSKQIVNAIIVENPLYYIILLIIVICIVKTMINGLYKHIKV